MTQLLGKVALITGGNQGIGLAIAEAFAAEGATLVLAARNAVKLNAACDRLRSNGARVFDAPTDVTDERQVESLFAYIMEACGRLDLLVNNAGAFDGGPLDELSLATWEKVLAVNLRAPFLCTRAAMRAMKAQGGGRIINIGSIAAQRVRPDSAPYATSKHGLWGLTQATALEGRAFGITCGCIHPGNTAVERRNTDKVEDAEPMIAPSDVARVAVLMAALPPHVEMLEAIVLPAMQAYVGRG